MKYEVRFAVTVSLEVDDHSDVIERCGTKEWQERLYHCDNLPSGPVEMLARCCGIFGMPLSHVDGWADVPDRRVRAYIKDIELEDIGVA